MNPHELVTDELEALERDWEKSLELIEKDLITDELHLLQRRVILPMIAEYKIAQKLLENQFIH